MDTYTGLNSESGVGGSQLISVQLAALLDLHQAEVVDAWIERKHTLPHARYREQSAAQLRATTERQLRAVVEILTTGPHALSESFLAAICHVYGQADLAVTVDACLLLKEAALPVIRRFFVAGDMAWQAVAHLDECVRWILHQHVRHYDVAMRRRQTDGHETDCASSASQQPATIGLRSDLLDPLSLPLASGGAGHFHQSEFSLSALEERDRLARELHDNLAQALGLLKMRLALTSTLLNEARFEQVHASLDEMKEIAAAAYTDAREVIFNLRTPIAAGSDFVASLRRYLTRYQASYGLEIQLLVGDIVTDLNVDVATQATRIIQEALTNVRKHAGASRAVVQMMQTGEALSISIEDNGRGFDLSRPLPEGGYGLRVMQERAASVSGRLKVHAAIDRGVRVELWLPLLPGVSK